MTVEQLINAAHLKGLCAPEPEKEVKGVYAGDLLSWVMGHGSCGNAWVTIMSNKNVIAVASLLDFSCVILAEGTVPDEEFMNTAKDKGVNILSSDEGIYEICSRLYTALGS